LFKPRDCVDYGACGGAAGAAALSLDQIGPAEGGATRLRERFGRWQAAAEVALLRFECHFVHDLAEEIGSARWFRAAGTLAVLASMALALWPDFSRLEAAPATHVDTTVRDEFRSQMVMPLGLGGDSGRRMGANPALVAPLASAPERTSLHMVATLGEGDSFTRMLQRAGVGPWDASRAAELVGAVTPIVAIRPGTRFEITLGRRTGEGETRPLEKLDFRARFDTALTLSRANGGLTIGRRGIAVDTTPLRIRGTVGAGLYRSARAAGAPPEVVQAYLRAIDQHFGLDSIGAGDQFDIVVEHRRSATGEEESGKLIYAGLEQGGKPRVQLMRFGDKGELFDASNPGGGSMLLSQPSGGLMMPVAGHVTSTFGLRRHPILGYTRMHAGVDFGAAWGSPIVAVASGVVTYAGWHGGHGNYVKLEHGGGLGTGYGHMSRIAVAPGTHVSAGQVIGYVGSSGLSTGPHLHYEVYQGGRTVNPLGVSFAAVRMQAAPVDAKRAAEIKKRLDALKGIKPLGSATVAGMIKKPGKLAYRD
jgi:murein DD-endopeptidase MepM/ murein hydrolase activator NlpD